MTAVISESNWKDEFYSIENFIGQTRPSWQNLLGSHKPSQGCTKRYKYETPERSLTT